MTPSLTALLCDLDGLLIDSEPLAMLALEQLLQHHGHASDPLIAQQLIGRRAHDNAELLIAHYGLPYTVLDLIAEQRHRANTLIEQQVEPMPGAAALLQGAQALGLQLAVATSSSRPYLQMVLRKFGWQHHFAATVTGEEVAHGKPAPDIFLQAATLLEQEPARCLVLEDSPPGVAAGLAAGAQVIAVPNPLTAPLEFPPAPRMESLHAVLDYLQQHVAKE